jgi:PTS system nitrogen regulatory IIA component
LHPAVLPGQERWLDLSVREVARLLNVSERTVHRWAEQGSIPAHRLHEQYRFNRVELQEWAAAQRRRVSPALFIEEGEAAAPPSLVEALARGGIHAGLPGATRAEVLWHLSRLPGVPAGVDRDLVYQLLLGRETLATTAVGDGIALPHARDPLVIRVPGPTVLLGFLASPVDFGALDGRPVRVVFTLFAPSIREHLGTLARLSFALHDPALRRLLAEEAPAEAILARLRAIEGARPAAGAAPAATGSP